MKPDDMKHQFHNFYMYAQNILMYICLIIHYLMPPVTYIKLVHFVVDMAVSVVNVDNQLYNSYIGATCEANCISLSAHADSIDELMICGESWRCGCLFT